MANLRLRNAEQAIFYLRKYIIAEPDAPPDVQEKTQEALSQALALQASTRQTPGLPTATLPQEPIEPRADPEPAPAPLQTVTAPPAVPSVKPPPPASTERPLRRPAWQVISGIGGLAVGTGLVGLGISALSTHGRCADTHMPFQPCSFDYHTIELGITLSMVGFSLIHVGSFLIALPGHPE